jgi:ribosome recycling factor
MKKQIQALEKSFSKVRTGRASVSLVEGIRADYYGTPPPSTRWPPCPFRRASDRHRAVGRVGHRGHREAIQRSELGLMPSNDGKVIRITIPPLTGERRKELVKVVKKMAEECKVKIRIPGGT